MKLDVLARETAKLDEAGFVARHPLPALVFLNHLPSAALARVDTPSDGTRIPRPQDFGTAAYPLTPDSLLETQESEPVGSAPDTLGISEVFFIEKSSRNPFENMITIGRAPNNDVCLPLATVSKLHAYVMKGPRGWQVTDQRSTNGTSVEEIRLKPGEGRALEDGTRIDLGPDVHMKFFTPKGLHAFLALYRSGVTTSP